MLLTIDTRPFQNQPCHRPERQNQDRRSNPVWAKVTERTPATATRSERRREDHDHSSLQKATIAHLAGSGTGVLEPSHFDDITLWEEIPRIGREIDNEGEYRHHLSRVIRFRLEE